MVTAIESIDEMPDYAVYIIVVEMFKREPKYGLTNWYQGLKFFRTKIYRYFHTHTKNIVISVTSLVRFNFRVLTSFSPRSKIALKFNHTQTTVWLSKWTKFQRKKKRRKITSLCGSTKLPDIWTSQRNSTDHCWTCSNEKIFLHMPRVCRFSNFKNTNVTQPTGWTFFFV